MGMILAVFSLSQIIGMHFPVGLERKAAPYMKVIIHSREYTGQIHFLLMNSDLSHNCKMCNFFIFHVKHL